MITIAFALLLAGLAGPDEPRPPTDADLRAISARGKDLAGHDQAAWHASDALQAKSPREGRVAGHVARKTDAGWVVAFGRLDPSKQKYLIAYEARQVTGDRYAVEEFDPPRAETGQVPRAARAIEVAVKDFTAGFQGTPRPYNVAALPAVDGKFWVYLVPAPTKPQVWPLGGDVRYLMAGDGSEVVEKRQLHKTIIEKGPPPEGKDGQQVAGMHSHILSDLPEDTDVFHVLSRKPSMPEFVATEHFRFLIEPDGAVKFAGKVEGGAKPK